MGLVKINIGLRANTHRKPELVEALADTGASYTMIPSKLAARLGLKPVDTLDVRLANGRKHRMAVAPVFVKLDGREAPCMAFISPNPQVLLGAESMELLGISVNPRGRKIVLEPWHGLMAM